MPHPPASASAPAHLLCEVHRRAAFGYFNVSPSSIRDTNSPLTSGLHHSLFFHGRSSFSSRTHCLQRDVLRKAQLNHFVRQQPKRPVRMSSRRLTARYRRTLSPQDEPPACQLALLSRTSSLTEGALKALPSHSACAHSACEPIPPSTALS